MFGTPGVLKAASLLVFLQCHRYRIIIVQSHTDQRTFWNLNLPARATFVDEIHC